MPSPIESNWYITTLVGIATIFSLSFFLYLHRQDKRRILNGFILNIFLVCLAIFIVCLSEAINNGYFIFFALVPFIVFFIISTLGLFALMIGLFINARILVKKEGKRFVNYLTLFLGIAIFLYLIIAVINPHKYIPEEVISIYTAVIIVFVYFLIDATSFLTAYLLYQFNKPKFNQDFIIVLGSGLINDEVTPLLKGRIDTAIDFYRKQSCVAAFPIFVFSGGQGSDEKLSEAKAMQNYATKKGIPLEHTILEDRSKNTYQNMLFSKEIIEELKGENYNSVFSSSEFHIFRSGIYARKAGLKSNGIGAKTAFYYWPNAMIREYIAILAMYQKRHVVIVSATLGLSAVLVSLEFLLNLFL